MPLDLNAMLSRLRAVRRAGGGYAALCPAHADQNPSLSIREGEGRILLHCHAGCDYRSILRALELESAIPLPRTSIRQWPLLPPEDDSSRIEHARRLWREAKPLAGTPAQAYLEGRGIRLPSWPPTLRFHPACPHPSGKRLPALIAAICRHREGKLRLRAVHRIYLAPDGRKAAVEPRKAALGAVKGSAVYLSRPAATLAVAEGVEDALAVMVMCQGDPRFEGWSYAAAVSAANLPALKLPPEVRTVIVAADADEPGREAAIKAACRFIREGKDARIAYPPAAKDFADALLNERRRKESASE